MRWVGLDNAGVDGTGQDSSEEILDQVVTFARNKHPKVKAGQSIIPNDVVFVPSFRAEEELRTASSNFYNDISWMAKY